MGLSTVIEVDSDKCVNCHMCISVCPAKYCIDGSGDTVEINSDLCIGCGSCIEACTHDARYPKDDGERFFRDLAGGKPIIAIAAPAVAANFAASYRRLNGYLHSLGVKAVFDVSFGAELTVKSYLEHVKKNNPKMIIAQPCPAIVTYIQLYKKELLEHLAPAHSPMLHTISMIREYFPEYAGHATAVLSPCLAKKREFEETGLGDYNVTYKSIDAHLSEKRIDLDRYPEMEFAGPKAERAVLFSSPGGLMRTAGRDAPEIPSRTRKIEGTHAIYPYLRSLPESVRKGVNPLLVDCLNCEAGCNGGPGTLTKNLPLDEIEAAVEARMREARKEYVGTFFDGKDAHAKRKVGKVLSDYWKEGIYGRNYRDLSSFYRIKKPGRAELEAIYADMKKETDEDILNCAACGYNSCEMMATAIFNGLNKPENCHLYRNKVIQESHEMTGRISSKLHDEIDASRRLLESVKTHM
ncbi:MAG: [Fe-Fe] hydrogenase large subunit C-terminal domain-containing protein, partial [Spirochaetia bacterium]